MSLSSSMEGPGVRSSSRLEAYSDALFSIVATVMIVPIAHTKLPEDQSLGHSFITLLLPKVAVYIYTFLLVSHTWATHVWLFEILENVDEFIVLVNLGLMMMVSFQPFTFTLLGEFPANQMAITLFGCIIVILGGIQLIFIFHVFHHPRMLKAELRLGSEMIKQRNNMYMTVFTPIIISIVALLCNIFSPILGLCILFFLLIGNWVRVKMIDCYRCCCRSRISNNDGLDEQLNELRTVIPLRQRMMKETISKERIEFLSDGVFAIIATLIILDICENDIPSVEDVDAAGGLAQALVKDGMLYLSYAGCFVTVGLQWYVHHSLLHYIKEMNKLMVIFNHLCLISVGLTPLAFNLTSDFNKHEFANNESQAIQFNCIVIFMAGMFQICIWITALFEQARHLSAPAHHGGQDHFYMTVKLAMYPLISLFVYFLTIMASNFKVTAFVSMQISAVAFFAILGLAFTKLWRCCRDMQSPLNYLEAFQGPENSFQAQGSSGSAVEDTDNYSAGSEGSTHAVATIS